MTEIQPDVSGAAPAVGYDPTTDTYHTTHDWTGPETLLESIVSSVAAVTGADPLRMDPLMEVVDPDALEQLFDRRNGSFLGDSGRVELSYAGCEVAVHGHGRIDIGPPTSR